MKINVSQLIESQIILLTIINKQKQTNLYKIYIDYFSFTICSNMSINNSKRF